VTGQVVTILAVLVGAAVLYVLVTRVEWTAMTMVALAPFGQYAKDLNPATVKGIAALLILAWVVAMFARTVPPQLRHPAVGATGILALIMVASFTLHPNGGPGSETMIRYFSFMAVMVILIDLMRTRMTATVIVRTYVVACTCAAGAGLVEYLTNGSGRAAGPIGDSNDFAFFLICALPLCLHLWQEGTRFRLMYGLCLALLLLTTLATYSRGAILGIAAMGLFALATRQVTLRVAAGALALGATAIGAVLVFAPGVVENSLATKEHVAGQNVDDRIVTWTMAAHMTADHPVLGLGPGAFEYDFDRYIGLDVIDWVPVVHNIFLEASSSFGVPGLLAFTAILGFGFAGAYRAFSRGGVHSGLGGAVCMSFVGTLVAAVFLSEQFYLPVWLLSAIGVAIDPAWRRPEAGSAAVTDEVEEGQPCVSSS
jgi:O-antigen ligase